MHNKVLLLTFWFTLLFVHGLRPFLHKSPLQPKRSRARRYERGSKINEMSHVLDLRHVVAGLAALR